MKPRTFILIAALSLAACSKNDSAGPAPGAYNNRYPSFSALKPGNYWVYENYMIDTNGKETLLPKLDSVYVVKDTPMRGSTWYEVRERGVFARNTPYWLRDSLHYIIDYNDGIKFSSVDFNTVFRTHYMESPYIVPYHDSIGYMERKMIDRNVWVLVPAGSFPTYSFADVWTMHPYFAQFGLTTRINRTRYAKGIGIVSQNWNSHIPHQNYYEKRLLRYHVK